MYLRTQLGMALGSLMTTALYVGPMATARIVNADAWANVEEDCAVTSPPKASFDAVLRVTPLFIYRPRYAAVTKSMRVHGHTSPKTFFVQYRKVQFMRHGI